LFGGATDFSPLRRRGDFHDACLRGKAFDRTTLAFLAVLIVATALRIWALKLAPINLYLDEAEFWAWSRTPAWGYLSARLWWRGDLRDDASLWRCRMGRAACRAFGAGGLGLGALCARRNVYGAWAGFWTGSSGW